MGSEYQLGLRLLLVMLPCGALTGCGATPGAPGHATEGLAIDAEALNTRAGTLLLTALRNADTERQALLELQAAGSAALPWIARARETHGQSSTALTEAIQAELAGLLAARGDADAVRELRRSTSNDSSALACRIAVLSPNEDQAELRAALQHSSERVRAAALRRLRRTALDPTLILNVTERARLDPVANVRAEALETLATMATVPTQRAHTIELLEASLTDVDPLPRAVAMRELATIDCTHAHTTLARWLSGAASRDGLAAVRALSQCGDALIARTIDQLRRALAASDVTLRSEAAATADAVAWVTVPDWIATALAHDPVPAVRLALALALRPTHPAAAHATLVDLIESPTSMVSVQAATILAAGGDPQAIEILRTARTQRDAKLRRVAFVALGHVPGRESDLEIGLRDLDVTVRLAVAGTLLRVTDPML
jgi:hypothetical protein